MADKDSGVESISRYTRRVMIAIGLAALVAVLLYFASQLIDVLLLAFAGILAAVAIDGVVRLCQRYLPIGRRWALVIALTLVCLAFGGLGALVGPRLAEELPQLAQQLPEAFRRLAEQVQGVPGVEAALKEFDNPASLLGQPMLDRFTSAFSTTFGALTNFLLILLVGFYLVLSPSEYIHHVVLLCPPARRKRLRQVLFLQGRSLRLWLVSRLISMLFVGIGVALGLMLMGVPMAGALGLVAGLLSFIPYLGPILGALPTILIAFFESPELALYAIGLYLVIETVESNIITPLAAKGMVSLPPAFTVMVQLAGAAVAGVAGVMLATPIAVVAVVAVQMLYVEDVLGDDVDVLGEH
ncbi:AI-2E family transporter [Billgrantia diversa]|uniref:AI-2E family transporter n=1 Tax=Halomonas sp. MCCC 1A13316 TaxID=2733487 RepID=UPI0018A3E94B|nr:AI-2E family transporter [Halomonas sp. MCCC 1A13316]QOR38105.1 AI-2E family transporter [Halomonas sp. MCCC 1A13316]